LTSKKEGIHVFFHKGLAPFFEIKQRSTLNVIFS